MQLVQCRLVDGDIVTAQRTGSHHAEQQPANDGEVGRTTLAGYTTIALVCDIHILG